MKTILEFLQKKKITDATIDLHRIKNPEFHNIKKYDCFCKDSKKANVPADMAEFRNCYIYSGKLNSGDPSGFYVQYITKINKLIIYCDLVKHTSGIIKDFKEIHPDIEVGLAHFNITMSETGAKFFTDINAKEWEILKDFWKIYRKYNEKDATN